MVIRHCTATNHNIKWVLYLIGYKNMVYAYVYLCILCIIDLDQPSALAILNTIFICKIATNTYNVILYITSGLRIIQYLTLSKFV